MIIETVKLTKLYRTGAGCREISLVVAEGQIFGLLGPNGAGKSTLVKMLVGLILPTSGEASLLGRPLGDVAARRSIGYLPENFRYHDWLSAREVLRFHAGLARMREAEGRIREVLDTAGLAAQADRKVGTFSKGMQQRLGLAAALLADPDLLFLDEPTSALDPLGRLEVREIISALKARGKTVFLNSHLLSEVEMVCDAVAIIDRGRIVVSGRTADLLFSSELEIEASDVPREALAALGERHPGLRIAGDKVFLRVGEREEIPSIVSELVAAGARLYGLQMRPATLESLFVKAVGKGADNGNNRGAVHPGSV